MSETSTGHAEKRVVDIEVMADLSRGCSYSMWSNPDRHYKELESLVSDFNSFIKDHRSMDHVQLSVRKVEEIRATCCDNPVETFIHDRAEDGTDATQVYDHGVEYCAHCGTKWERPHA